MTAITGDMRCFQNMVILTKLRTLDGLVKVRMSAPFSSSASASGVGTAVTVALFGFLTALLTLFFMALKTGLHAHGPEFTPSEINWVIARIPLWTAVGLLSGAGLGLVGLSVAGKQ